MASSEHVLPPEVWVEVIKNVPPKDLCNVVLASTQMNSLASSQDLWAGTKLNKKKVKNIKTFILLQFISIHLFEVISIICLPFSLEKKKVKRDGLIEVFTINRFENIKELDFSHARATSERKKNLLKQIPQTPLEEVNFRGNRMSGVPAEVLAEGVAHLKTVDLSWTWLTTTQSIKVLEASIETDSLEKMSLRGVLLLPVYDTFLHRAFGYLPGGVPATLLARAIGRLQSIDLKLACLSRQQCVSILEESLNSTTLVEVNLACTYLDRVPASLLARAVSRLQSVKLKHTFLTTEQLTELLQASLSSKTLVEVSLAETNLTGVPTELLASAVGRLQKVNLSCTWNTRTHMTGDQYIAVGQAVLSSTSLRQADLRSSRIRENLPAPLLNSLKLVDYVKI